MHLLAGRGLESHLRRSGHRRRIGVGTAIAVPSLRTRCAVFPRRALQSVVSTSGLARQSMSLGHREQPQISEEDIWPSPVIAKAVTPDPDDEAVGAGSLADGDERSR